MPKGVYERTHAYKGKYKVGTVHTTPYGDVQILDVNQDTRKRGTQTRVVIRFLKTGAVRECQANNLSQGKVKDFYQPTVYGLGYIGSAIRIPQRGNGDIRRAYDLWANMLKRVAQDPAYVDVAVDARWLNFTQFLNSLPSLPGYDAWVAGEAVHLDKDLRVPGNRTYGLDTCWFIPASQNLSKSMG